MTTSIRPLTSAEYDIYAGATALATEYVKSFRDSIALLRPIMDETGETTKIDESARVYLYPGFFDDSQLSNRQRAALVLHETLHVLSAHFGRARALGAGGRPANVAQDLEIGTTLHDHPQVDASCMIRPGFELFQGYPSNNTFEQYFEMLPEQSQDSDNSQSDPSSGDENSQPESGDSDGDEPDDSHNGDSSSGSDDSQAPQPCGTATSADEEAADEADVERASESEKNIAKKNTTARIQEELKNENRSYGMDPAKAFLGKVLTLMEPPKVDWRKIFERDFNKSSSLISRDKTSYTYRRVNRKLSGGPDKFIYPGLVRYIPQTALGLDSSASMSAADYRLISSEWHSIMRRTAAGRSGVTVFSIDTEVSGGLQKIKSVQDMVVHGGGGTNMAPAFAELRKMSRERRPDIFVLGSDGGFDWNNVMIELRRCRKLFSTIILITNHSCFQCIPSEARRLAKIIDVSDG